MPFPLPCFLASGIPFGMLAVGRESAAPPMSCLLGMLCQETFDGIHSVAKVEYSRVGFFVPQLGHGGPCFAEAETRSSNRSPHDSQRYS